MAELRDRATEFLQTEKVVIGAVMDLVPDKIGLAYGSLKGRDVFGKKLADIFEAGSYVIGGVAVMTLQPDVPVGTPSTPKDAPAP